MEIFPAIDLLNSQAVRLTKGEKSSAKIYGFALDFAKFFQDCGAKWLHIVDLDGAFDGSPKNLNTIEQIVKSTTLQVQVGGGIRTEETLQRYIDVGVSRAILGSSAVKKMQWCKQMSLHYPIAISIDSKNGKVATHGWVETTNLDAVEFAKEFANSKIQAIICTDINQDGLLSGMNYNLTQTIAQSSNLFTIASGGFSSINDLEELKKYPDIKGVIIGKAFYEGNINFKNIKF